MNLNGIIEDLPNETTPLNKATFTNLANAILNVAFPINKTELFYDDLDHSNYLGFTWVRDFIGRVPVGIDTSQTEFNTIGKTGGSKYMQAHNHNICEIIDPSGTYDFPAWSAKANGNTGATPTKGYASLTTTFGDGYAQNLQPYKVLAIWRRTA